MATAGYAKQMEDLLLMEKNGFAQRRGFHPRKMTPLNPRENGEVEEYMKNIGKAWEISQALKVPFQEELSRQLQGYRATPHSSTEKSPAELAGKISYSMNALGDSD